MKKPTLIFCLVLLALSLLPSCGGSGHSEQYELGFEEGFSEGYAEGRNDSYDEIFESGYDVGYEDGYAKGYDDSYVDPDRQTFYRTEEAIDYVIENGYFHPFEAWEIIDSYRNSIPYLEDDTPPSKEEYQKAVDSMIEFFFYFYLNAYRE